MAQNQKILRLEVDADFSGERLDVLLAHEYPDFSRSFLQRLITGGQVTVNNHAARPSHKLRAGDSIILNIPSPVVAVLEPQDIPFEVIYADQDFIVINKPAGLTVYPAPGHYSGTLVNALVRRFPDLAVFGDSLRPGIVHRLDKDTSGLMVIARNEKSRQHLVDQFKTKAVKKCYMVLVKGKLAPAVGIIDAPIGRHPSHRQRMAVVTTGRDARTSYKVREYLDGFTLVEAEIETGRTHQIRVHFAAIGYPVAGDGTYGIKLPFLKRQFLHAYRLEFLPLTGEQRLVFSSSLPDDLVAALRAVKR